MITQSEVVDYLKGVKVGELRNLITSLENELGVTASAPQIVVRQESQKVEEPEQTEFDVVLTGYDATKKVAVIQAVRKLTGLGLKESKAVVEGIPTAVKEGISKEEAEAAAAALQEAAGTVEVR